MGAILRYSLQELQSGKTRICFLEAWELIYMKQVSSSLWPWMMEEPKKKEKRVVETTSAAESKQGIPLLAEVMVSSWCVSRRHFCRGGCHVLPTFFFPLGLRHVWAPTAKNANWGIFRALALRELPGLRHTTSLRAAYTQWLSNLRLSTLNWMWDNSEGPFWLQEYKEETVSAFPCIPTMENLPLIHIQGTSYRKTSFS